MTINAYVSLAAHDATPIWTASTAKSLGAYVRRVTPTSGADAIWKCTTAGTTGASEPAWTNATTDGGTQTDGTVTWTNVTGRESENATNNWKSAYRQISDAIGPTKVAPASNPDARVYVDKAHVYQTAAATSISYPSLQGMVICVDRTTAAIPPVPGDWTTGAQEQTQTSGAISFNAGYFYGINWTQSSGTGSSPLGTFNAGNSGLVFDTCKFIWGSTNATGPGFDNASSSGSNSEIYFKDCQWKPIATTHTFTRGNTFSGMRFDNFSVDTSTAVPTNMFSSPSSAASSPNVYITNSDFSNLTAHRFDLWFSSQAMVQLENCKLPTSLTLPTFWSGITKFGFRMVNCDDGTSNKNYKFYDVHGDERTEIWPAVYRHNGGSDGVTPYSLRLTARNTAQPWAVQSRSTKLAKRNATVGSSMTATVYAMMAVDLNPVNGNLWAEFSYLGDTGSPKGTKVYTRSNPADVTNVTADSSSDWDDGITARANSFSYSVGDLIRVASNPGRVFLCTSGGGSAASEPAGYASAVDGGSVTDSVAVFKALRRIKFTATFTPQKAGLVTAQIMCAQAPSHVLYIDPKLEVV